MKTQNLEKKEKLKIVHAPMVSFEQKITYNLFSSIAETKLQKYTMPKKHEGFLPIIIRKGLFISQWEDSEGKGETWPKSTIAT
jgi:hypothetical protein